MDYYQRRMQAFQEIERILKTAECVRSKLVFELVRKYGMSELGLNKHINKLVEEGYAQEEDGNIWWKQ